MDFGSRLTRDEHGAWAESVEGHILFS
jgi:hypothetical protein